MPNGDAVVIELVSVTAGEFASLPEQEQEQFHQLLSTEAGNLYQQRVPARIARTSQNLDIVNMLSEADMSKKDTDTQPDVAQGSGAASS